MALALPRLVAFLGEGDDAMYLGCKSNSHLSYSFAVLDRSVAKFEVHQASTGKEYVHIRSCYNNKYWVRSSESEYAIVAGASEPIEDKNSWNCTLFKPDFDKFEDKENVSFQHVQIGQKVGISPNLELLLMPQASDVARSRFFDYNNYVVLPKYVSFKDNKGKFYKLQWVNDHPFIQASGNDSGLTRIMHETSYNRHGNYRIKNLDTGKFWRRSPNWIWADHENADEFYLDILFLPIEVTDDGVVGLRNLGNDRFIKRLTAENNDSCLNASAVSIVEEARLTVVEPVLRRVVEVIEFRLEDARIYNEEPLVMGQDSASNNTSVPNSTTLIFSHPFTKSSTWSNSVNLTVGVKATFTAGIPTIGETEIEISAEVTQEYQWGATIESEEVITGSYTAHVPPGGEEMVKMVVTSGQCDVPFTYRQSDTLTDGTVVSNIYDDGLYTGVNAYNYHFEATIVSK